MDPLCVSCRAAVPGAFWAESSPSIPTRFICVHSPTLIKQPSQQQPLTAHPINNDKPHLHNKIRNAPTNTSTQSHTHTHTHINRHTHTYTHTHSWPSATVS